MDRPSDVIGTLRLWLAEQSEAGLAWLDATAAGLAAGAPDRVLFLAFAAAPRRVGRDDLPACTPLRLQGWTRDQAARVLLLLAGPRDDDRFMAVLDRLFGVADLAELVCLYQALPLLPCPERLAARAAEGVRSNMLAVFKAVALGNAYPARWLDEGAWNQMVLKAVFTGCPLRDVLGLDQRANLALARMLMDYARERQAAGRSVPADLWRPVEPFAGRMPALHEPRHAPDSPEKAQQQAAAYPHPDAGALLDTRSGLASEISGLVP